MCCCTLVLVFGFVVTWVHKEVHRVSWRSVLWDEPWAPLPLPAGLPWITAGSPQLVTWFCLGFLISFTIFCWGQHGIMFSVCLSRILIFCLALYMNSLSYVVKGKLELCSKKVDCLDQSKWYSERPWPMGLLAAGPNPLLAHSLPWTLHPAWIKPNFVIL